MPAEDFQTYAEVDPNGRIAVTANEITVTGLTKTEDAHVSLDVGAGAGRACARRA